jgi:hypothetical protein
MASSYFLATRVWSGRRLRDGVTVFVYADLDLMPEPREDQAACIGHWRGPRNDELPVAKTQ